MASSGGRRLRKYQTETRLDVDDDVEMDTMVGAASFTSSMDELVARGDTGLDEASNIFGGGDDYYDDDNDDGGGGDSSLGAGSARGKSSRFVALGVSGGGLGNVQRVSPRRVAEHLGVFYYALVAFALHPARGCSRSVFRAYVGFVVLVMLFRVARSAMSDKPGNVVFGLLVSTAPLLAYLSALELIVRRRLLLRAIRVHYVFEQALCGQSLSAAERQQQREKVTALFRKVGRRCFRWAAVVAVSAFFFYNLPRAIWFADPRGYDTPAERQGSTDDERWVDALLVPHLGNRGMQAILAACDVFLFGTGSLAVASVAFVYSVISHQRNVIAEHHTGDDVGAAPDHVGWRLRMSFAFRLSQLLYARVSTTAIKPYYAIAAVSNCLAFCVLCVVLVFESGREPSRLQLASPLLTGAALALVGEYAHRLLRKSRRVIHYLGPGGEEAARHFSLNQLESLSRGEAVAWASGRGGGGGGSSSSSSRTMAAQHRMTIATAVTGLVARPKRSGSEDSDGDATTTTRVAATGEVDRAAYVSGGVRSRDVTGVLFTMVGQSAVLALLVVGITSFRLTVQFPKCTELAIGVDSVTLAEDASACSDSQALAQHVESAFVAQPLLWLTTCWVVAVLFGWRRFVSRLFDVAVVSTLMAAFGAGLLFWLYRREGGIANDEVAFTSACMVLAVALYAGSSIARELRSWDFLASFFLYTLVMLVSFLAVKFTTVQYVEATSDDERLVYVVAVVPVCRFVAMSVITAIARRLVPLGSHPSMPMDHAYVMLALPLSAYGIISRLFIFNLEGVEGVVSSVVLVSAQEIIIRTTAGVRLGVAAYLWSGSLRRAVETMEAARTSDFLPDRIFVSMLVEHYSLVAAFGITVVGRLAYGLELQLGELAAVYALQLAAELLADWASVLFEEGLMDLWEVAYWRKAQASFKRFFFSCSYLMMVVPSLMTLEYAAIVRLS